VAAAVYGQWTVATAVLCGKRGFGPVHFQFVIRISQSRNSEMELSDGEGAAQILQVFSPRKGSVCIILTYLRQRTQFLPRKLGRTQQDKTRNPFLFLSHKRSLIHHCIWVHWERHHQEVRRTLLSCQHIRPTCLRKDYCCKPFAPYHFCTFGPDYSTLFFHHCKTLQDLRSCNSSRLRLCRVRSGRRQRQGLREPTRESRASFCFKSCNTDGGI